MPRVHMAISALLLAVLLSAAPHGAATAPQDPATAPQDSATAPQDAAARGAATAPARAPVSAIRIEGPISPTTTNYVTRALSEAGERGSVLLLVHLDTPGGLLESTRRIVQALFDAEVPVVVYVSPDGARAASAGTFITLAAHVAAMAPSTTIGAASPVTMGPGGGSTPDTVMQTKLFSYAESLMESIAQRRGRNVEWAISAVREGASVTEREALELGVIDLVAADREELLARLDGRVVEGDSLRSAGAPVELIPQNLAERFFGLIIRPELMLILTLVAIYGIVGEVTNPGAIVPGMAGAIALILLLFATAAMPINTAGFLLIGLAIVLFVAEAFTPTFGLLTAGGAVAFFLGGLMLFQDLPESMALSWTWLLPATVLTTLFFLWIVTAGIKIQFAGSRTGPEAMVGQTARVVDAVDPDGGLVLVDGEYWNAVSGEPIAEGRWCEIEDVDGLTVRVRPTRKPRPRS